MTPIPNNLAPRISGGLPFLQTVKSVRIRENSLLQHTFLCKTNPISTPTKCTYPLHPHGVTSNLHFCRNPKTNPNEPNSKPISTQSNPKQTQLKANRSANLRLATIAQNNMNKFCAKGTSKYKGVYFQRDLKRWRATITFKRKKSHLGYFENEIDAARAYDEAARKYFGEFAYLNFPPRQNPKGVKPRITRIITNLLTIGESTRNEL
jgi:hypothetical protein